MRPYHEDSRGSWHAVILLLEEPLVEAYQLSNKSHIRVCHRPPLLDVGETLIEIHPLLEDQVGEADSGTP